MLGSQLYMRYLYGLGHVWFGQFIHLYCLLIFLRKHGYFTDLLFIFFLDWNLPPFVVCMVAYENDFETKESKIYFQ